MNSSLVDHIVIGANNLEQGRRYIRDLLDVDIPFGGRHPLMGTHNCVTRLQPGVYLEVIAIDPDADVPVQPRWFDLDNPCVQNVLSDQPRLLTWVVNTVDINGLSGLDSGLWGRPLAMQRDGLEWLITVPQDGRLPAAGLLPGVIQWLCPSPVDCMFDSGCVLESITLLHQQPEWLKQKLSGIGALDLAGIQYAGNGEQKIEVTIKTAAGETKTIK